MDDDDDENILHYIYKISYSSLCLSKWLLTEGLTDRQWFLESAALFKKVYMKPFFS